jgi:hypothetical protein
MEMLGGVSFPIIILTIWEIYAAITGKKNTYVYQEVESEKTATTVKADTDEETQKGQKSSGNDQGLKVIGLGVTGSGCIITILGLMADHGQGIVCLISAVMIIIGLYCIFKSKRK